VFFGDGATSRGDWHEGMNLAAVQKRRWCSSATTTSTPTRRRSKQMACANVADRGPAYGIPAEIVDGNDAFAVYHAAGRAAEHARRGLGPYLIECKTFRMSGHSAHDAADYVPKHLWEEWGAKCPILRLERLMQEEGWASEEEIRRIDADIRGEVDEAVAWAEAQPYPDPSELLEHVYDPETRA
jgi:TPP-dependent pyruvate/acetoin dehydrogenase alpha subunit